MTTSSMAFPVVLVLTCAAMVGPAAVVPRAQTTEANDPFHNVAWLIGRWEGTSEGKAGSGTVERTYDRILGGRFIRVQNRSAYPPQEKNPKGEVHEDLGILSVDTAAGRLVLRQFHTEGFVNEYVQDVSASFSRLVLVTEAIENIPSGWRARETYAVLNPDEFEEIFELAAPGKDFEPYSRTHLRRVK
jgi:hypothetical protein